MQAEPLCLHIGVAVNKIFDVSPNTTATAAEENPWEKAVKALIGYFTPQEKKREFEIYVFLQAKQESLENHSISHQIKTISTHMDFATSTVK